MRFSGFRRQMLRVKELTEGVFEHVEVGQFGARNTGPLEVY